ncbi:MAG: GNAT family N-acetyltransferase [Croceitalea sp.]|nr:GNAT family N-acetyltransferase [Croceitalea sp.]NNL08932.1 GNAT family N-acetyltransferase [Croceitalea sp.]
MHNYEAFETDRLILKPTDVEDAAFLIELFNSPKWLQFIGDRNVKTLESAKNYIRIKITSQFDRLGFATYTLIRKSDYTKVGTIGLYDREGLEGIDIGFALLPLFEGKGYAYEAAKILKYMAFNEFNLHQLKAITMKENFSAQKLLERLHMSFKGTIVLPNSYEQLMLYSLSKY